MRASSCAFRSLLSLHQYTRRGAPAASVVWTVPETLKQLWTGYGVGVEGSWLTKRAQGVQAVDNAADHVYTRVPDLLELRVMKPDGERAIESSRQRAVVADDRSTVVAYKLEKSRAGRDSLGLTFDADGFLSSIAVEGSSAVAAGLSAATGAVEGFTGGVEGGGSCRFPGSR
jgi:hypothetical protein